MATPTTVEKCMRRSPLTIQRDASLVKAIEIIVDNRLTGLTVTDDAGNAVGVLSELDCIEAILADIYNEGEPKYTLVEEAMSSDLNTCKSTDDIVEVAQAMLETRQRRRPVVSDGKLIGQVSSNNILWALMEHSRRKLFLDKK